MGIERIVSGGQTGADRAALDFAIKVGIPYDGWCPKDGWAEDCEEPPGLLTHYPHLRSTGYSDISVRTRWNVRDADATVIFVGDANSPGTNLTIETAETLGKPHLVCEPDNPEIIAEFLRKHPSVAIVNIAGPRESEYPGIYSAAYKTLIDVWKLIAFQN